VGNLKDRLIKEWRRFPQDVIDKAIKEWHVRDKGGIFEHKLKA